VSNEIDDRVVLGALIIIGVGEVRLFRSQVTNVMIEIFVITPKHHMNIRCIRGNKEPKGFGNLLIFIILHRR
jgi:hypothetical protein